MVYTFISGSIAMGCAVAASFFYQFWTSTRDRLFAIFAFSFGILALERLIPVIAQLSEEHSVFQYVARLVAFVFILVGIIDKNLKTQDMR